MGYLRYKGYVGSVTYNEQQDCLEGEIQGLRLTDATYRSQSVEGLEKGFRKAVDDYIARCEKKGIKPRKSYDGPMQVRLGIDLATKVAERADADDITINAVIKQAVKYYLDMTDSYVV